jgi:hypothetical protein
MKIKKYAYNLLSYILCAILYIGLKFKKSFIQPMQTYITTQNVPSRKQQRLHKAGRGELPTLMLHIPIHPVLLNFNFFWIWWPHSSDYEGHHVMPCNFKETHYLQLQCWRVRKASNQKEAGSKQTGISFIKILIYFLCMHLHTLFPHAMKARVSCWFWRPWHSTCTHSYSAQLPLFRYQNSIVSLFCQLIFKMLSQKKQLTWT